MEYLERFTPNEGINIFLISHNVQPTLSTSEKVKDVHLPLHTAPVIARSAATRQSSAFDFVAAFLDCRASCRASLAAKGFFAMTAHLFAQLNLVANQEYL